jgi:hypothetical protein
VIVVGAGAASAVLAARQSEDGSVVRIAIARNHQRDDHLRMRLAPFLALSSATQREWLLACHRQRRGSAGFRGPLGPANGRGVAHVKTPRCLRPADPASHRSNHALTYIE